MSEAQGIERAETPGAIATRAQISLGEGGLQLRNLDEMFRVAQAWAKSTASKDTAETVLVKLIAGAELGLTPMRSLAYLVVINGRMSVMGDAAKAIIRAAGVLRDGTDFDEEIVGTGEERYARVTTFRRGWRAPKTTTFSWAEAKQAKLLSKGGPWTEYTDRMLKYRALGFHNRDNYSDVMLGLYITEEVRDFPADTPAPATSGSAAPAVEPVPEAPAGDQVIDVDPMFGDELVVQAAPAPEPESQPEAEEVSEVSEVSSQAPAPEDPPASDAPVMAVPAPPTGDRRTWTGKLLKASRQARAGESYLWLFYGEMGKNFRCDVEEVIKHANLHVDTNETIQVWYRIDERGGLWMLDVDDLPLKT